MTAYSAVESAVEAMKSGAVDYLIKPLDFDQLKSTLFKTLEHSEAVRSGERFPVPVEGIVGNSPAVRRMLEMIHTVAPSEATVLINGKSGTGKELVARAIHNQSQRKDGPVGGGELRGPDRKPSGIRIVRARERRFHGRGQAPGTGVFCKRTAARCFWMKSVKFPCSCRSSSCGPSSSGRFSAWEATPPSRWMCASWRRRTVTCWMRSRPGASVRICIIGSQSSAYRSRSLQERSEDIPLLAEHFLKVFGERNRKDVKGFTPKAMDMLVKYPWPGNVRELENAVERAVVLLFGSYVSERELPLAVTQTYEQEDDTEPSSLSVPLEGATLEDVEREAILRMLDSVGDNKSEAAKRLGISRKTLHTKLKRYGQEQD